MPRIVAYVLLTKAGPSAKAQLEAIEAARLPIEPAYTDDLTKRRALERREFTERDLMLRQMRHGDSVVVATPGRLGIGKDDVVAMLEAVEAKGGAVIDASTGDRIAWTPELLIGLAFLDRAVIEHKQLAAAAARRAAAAKGIKGGAPKKPFDLPEAEVKRRWFDQVGHPSQQEVARASGKSARTLYTLFGPRSGRRNARKKA